MNGKQIFSISDEVRALKEDNAAEYEFNVQKIAAAVQEMELNQPELMVSRYCENEINQQAQQTAELLGKAQN